METVRMANKTSVALTDLEHALGHHTAHLEPDEQIEVLEALKLSIDGTIENIRADSAKCVDGEGHGT
jgi:hypothetical protein